MKTLFQVFLFFLIGAFILILEPEHFHVPLGLLFMILITNLAKKLFKVDEDHPKNNDYETMIGRYNKPKETNQKPAGGFLIAHFKRYVTSREGNEDQ